MLITKLSLLLSHYNINIGASLLATTAYNSGDLGSIPGLRRSPGGGNGCHFSTLTWRIPWTEEPGGLQSTGSQKVGHDWVTNILLNINIYTVGFIFSLVAWLAGSYFPNQGLNLCPQQWKCEVLTTGPPGNSHIGSLEKLLNKGILFYFIFLWFLAILF